MGVMDRLAVLFDGLLWLVSDVIRVAMIDPIVRDADYFRGFLSGLVLAFVIGYISLSIRRSWADVLLFFAGRPPSLNAGPSPFDVSSGCAAAVIRLIALFVLIIIVVIGLLRAILGA